MPIRLRSQPSLSVRGSAGFPFRLICQAAELIYKAIADTIKQKRVTYDLHRLMEGATKLKTSEYGSAIIENMG